MANKCWMPNLNRVNLIFTRLKYVIQKWTFKMSWKITALPLTLICSLNTQYIPQIKQTRKPGHNKHLENKTKQKKKTLYSVQKLSFKQTIGHIFQKL